MNRNADEADDAGPAVSGRSDDGWSAGPRDGWRKERWSNAGASPESWGSESPAWQENEGRAQEKLDAPEFDGKSSDSGRAVRSYLRRVDVWCRLSTEGEGQQATMLCHKLEGKAREDAEELDATRLASDGGVKYFKEWRSKCIFS